MNTLPNRGQPADAPRNPANAAAFAWLPLVALSVPFMDIPAIGGGAYVRPLGVPLAALLLVLMTVQLRFPPTWRVDRLDKLWGVFLAWALVGDMIFPWIIPMPHEMKGQTLGGRILRDLTSLMGGMVFWAFLRLSIQSTRQAVVGVKWICISFAVVTPFLVVQSLVITTHAPPFLWIDAVMSILHPHNPPGYKRIFGLAPEASMLADQLITLYLPFATAALLMGSSLFRRRILTLRVEVWITIVSFLALVFSQSRGGLIGLVVLAACGWILATQRRSARRINWKKAALVPLAVLCVGGGLGAMAGSRALDFIATFTSLDDSIDNGIWSNVTRAGAMVTGLDIAVDHPLGVGTGALPFLFEQHVPDWALVSPEIQGLLGNNLDSIAALTGYEGSDLETRLPDAKALIVRVLAELGLPGAILLALIWTRLVAGCWRTFRATDASPTVVAVALGALMSLLAMLPLSFSVNSYIWVHWIFVAAVAATIGRLPRVPPPARRKPQPSPAKQIAIR